MAGNAENVSLWRDADVYIAPVGTTAPDDVTDAWAVDWDAVGLLNGDDGFSQNRDEQSSEHYAWGGKLVKSVRSNHKRTFTFVCMEDNETVFALVNPGSSRSTTLGVTTASISIPEYSEFAVGMEVREGDKIMRRICARASVEEIGEIKESEKDPTVFEVTVVVYPDSNGVLFTEISGSAA